MFSNDSADWFSRYLPPKKSVWTGRNDSNYIHNSIQELNLKKFAGLKKNSIGFIGFCSDEGIIRNGGKKGAKEGPKILKESLGKLPFFRKESIDLYDCGDIFCDDAQLEESQSALGKGVECFIKAGGYPIIFGGGHEVAFGTYLGLSHVYPQEEITIINFDAHYDLRPHVDQKSTSGTPFSQISELCQRSNMPFVYCCFGIQKLGNAQNLVDRAVSRDVKTIFAEDFFFKSSVEIIDLLEDILMRSNKIYVTLCLDVFSSAWAPGVSAPQPLGLTPWQIIPLLRILAASKKTVCFEIAELSPPLDLNNRTSQLAASLVSEFIHYLDFQSETSLQKAKI